MIFFNSRENIQQPKSIIVDKSESSSPFTIHTNRYQVLDSNTSFETEFEKAKVVCKHLRKQCITESRRPSNVVNPRPENDKLQYGKLNVVNGDASYSNVDRKLRAFKDFRGDRAK